MTPAEQQHMIRVVAAHSLNHNSLPSDDRRAGIVAQHLTVVEDQVPDPRDPRQKLAVARVAVSDGKGGERLDRDRKPYSLGLFVAELAQSTPELRW